VICLYEDWSARTLGGPVNILSLVAFEAMGVVVIVIWFEE
jgi:hypothetical protein